MKRFALLWSVLLLLTTLTPLLAQDTIQYTSQPDEIAIFYNNIAYARDTIRLPGGTAVSIVLPATVFADTLVLRENDRRVPDYRLTQGSAPSLQWASRAGDEARVITLEYLMSGTAWKPKYDLFLGAEGSPRADFDFFAEISNSALTAEAVRVRLIAGQVDLSSALTAPAPATMNQYIAGYAEPAQPVSLTGAATIQYIYEAGTLALAPGDLVYRQIASASPLARRVNLWNAATDRSVTVIYKLLNEADVPFADGIVRSYQNGLFLGSDGIELTPIGSEGSVTVGALQNVRVNRTEETLYVNNAFGDYTQYSIRLTLNNFADEPVSIEVVDAYPFDATALRFDGEPERQGDDLLRWQVTIPAGGEITLAYEYRRNN
ncbi:MAG: DUF4139 domain-containing protein [Anaerolineae bacterium]|jgi:hypothetical protein|nr:DUF4139 domain-containing protein [Anaerolineae bacterium]